MLFTNSENDLFTASSNDQGKVIHLINIKVMPLSNDILIILF